MDGARISRDAEAEHDGLRERPRALTTVSCNVCRTRKTRCGGDGREPCAFCSGRGLVCVYPARPAKRFAAAGSAQRGDETPTAQAPPPAAQLLPQPYSAAPPHSRYYAAPPSRPFGLGYGFAGAPQGLSAMPAPGYPSQSYRPMDSLLAAVQSSTAPLVPYPNYGRPGLAESFAAAAPHHPSAAELSSVHFSGHGALQGLESSLESDRTEMDQTFSAAPNEIPTEQQSARLAVRDLAPPLTDASRLPISWSDVATMSNTAVSVAPSTAVDPRRSVADLYPTIPPALLPRLDIILALIDLHMAYRNPLWNFIHTPTFKKRIELGTADPVLVLVVVWSGSFLVPKKLAAAGNGNHSNFPIDDDPLLHFDIDSKELEAECLRALSKQTEAIGILGEQGQADPAAVVSQLQALFIVRPILIHQGNISALTETMLGVEELFPHAKFGLLPADDYQARDPRNLASWIASEERARANAIYLMSDMARSAAYRTPCKSLPARPDAEQPWLDMPAPCPDLIFESLPPSPASAEDWIAWDARDRASGGILDSVRLYPIRHLISWVDQPKGSQLRESIVQFAMGGLLRNGLNAALPLIIDLWARVTVCMDVFSQHAFRIYDPPSDDSEDARRARELRSKIVAALDEFWEALPSEMRESGANSDHKALLEVAARWWGRTRQFTIAPILFFIHSFVILLHSADNPISQLESKDPDWPSTTAFGRAESSAEGISRLVVSLLGAPRPREEGADSEPSELSAEEHRIERMKLIVPIWSFAISRAAWVQCMSARRLRRALESAATAEEQEAAIKQLNSLRMTMDTVLSCLDCMRSDGAAWRNVYDAYSVTHRAAVRIMDGEKWEPGELFSDEEVAKLGWWVDTKAFNHESFASK